MFDRFDICEAYYLYDVDWGPTPYGARLHKIGFSPAPSLSLASANENVKEIYGRLVRQHEGTYVAYERLYRRHPEIGPWPGTQNMGCESRTWLRKRGLLAAIECYL